MFTPRKRHPSPREADPDRAGGLDPPPRTAAAFVLGGRVQGVGFRPFVHRIASALNLTGEVQNQLGQVRIHVEGAPAAIDEFAERLVTGAPPLAVPVIDSRRPVRPRRCERFDIVASSADAAARVCVPPDYFTCDDCLAELHDPADRRAGYPFINCTQCGPRYTLIERLPYDRPNTSMAGFELCDACRREYDDPADRRFHAEPTACPACGPALEFRDSSRRITETRQAMGAAARILRAGRIVAVKGVGGYHLMCDARCEHAVQRLRRRKHRPAKPLAVMFPADGRDGADRFAGEVIVDAADRRLLRGPVRPIVLCRRDPAGSLAAGIAPGLDEIGVFLPYSPLHHLLLGAFGGPLVATSGNLSGEPVLTDAAEVATRLTRVADAYLHHDRPIVRPADDPVFRHIAGRARPLRLGRGCAPLETELPCSLPHPVLAVGAHLKNTVTLAWEKRAVVSPHIGTMHSARSLDVFARVAADLQSLYGVRAEAVACDAHPGYTTARWARDCGLPVTEVFHHHAHASAVAGEFGGGRNWLVFAWDGTGYGADGTLWGGEALYGAPGAWRRVATLRPFSLPGGDRAGRAPWRSAAALCWETDTAWSGLPAADSLPRRAWENKLNCPRSSAAGRLFDAAAAFVLGLAETSFEAEGPMRLEAACSGAGRARPLPLRERDDGLLESDWQPLLAGLMGESRAASARAADFHASMAAALCDQAVALRSRYRIDRVGLAGGVFQNRVLTELAVDVLRSAGFEVCLGERLPANDACISFGQAVEYAARAAAGR